MRPPRRLDAAKLSDRAMIDALRQILGKDPLYNMSAGGTDTERFYQPPAYMSPEQTRRHPTA